MQCLIWCLKNDINLIFFYFLQKYPPKYGGKDVEKILRDNCVFNHANACIRIHCITNTMNFEVLVIHTSIHMNRVYKNNAKYGILVILVLVMLVLAMLALVILAFFLCSVWFGVLKIHELHNFF